MRAGLEDGHLGRDEYNVLACDARFFTPIPKTHDYYKPCELVCEQGWANEEKQACGIGMEGKAVDLAAFCRKVADTQVANHDRCTMC